MTAKLTRFRLKDGTKARQHQKKNDVRRNHEKFRFFQIEHSGNGYVPHSMWYSSCGGMRNRTANITNHLHLHRKTIPTD